MKRTSVLLADDHALLIDCLARRLQRDFEVLGVAHDGRRLIEMAKHHRPDVIVTDISMPHINGIDAARIVRKEVRSTKVLFLTMYTDLPLIEEAFRAGASGFVLKMCGADELVEAIQAVAKGNTYITPRLAGDLISTLLTTGSRKLSGETALTLRQRQVVQLAAEGKTMKEVAALLEISTRTAETHKYESMRRLGVERTADLIRYAVSIKLI